MSEGKVTKKILIAGIISVVILTAIAVFVPKPSAGIYPDDIFCVVSVNGSPYAKENRVFVKQGDDISVMPVFIIDGEYYSNADMFSVDNTVIYAKQPPKTEYSWYQINPEYRDEGYDNFTLAPKKQFSSYLDPMSVSRKR